MKRERVLLAMLRQVLYVAATVAAALAFTCVARG